MSQQTVTQEELETLRNFEVNFTKAVYEIGQLHLQQYMVEKQLSEIKENIKSAENHVEVMSKQEKEFTEQLIQKYGGTTVDLETGIIVP